MLKMSLAVIPKDSRAGRAKLTAGPGNDSHRAGLAPEIRPVIHGESTLVLPLVNHLVQQCVNGLLPPVAADVPPADHDLGATAFLSAKDVVTQPAFHPARHTDGNGGQLAAEPRFVQPAMMVLENTHERLIGRVRRLRRAVTAGARLVLTLPRRVEIQ